MTKFRCKNEHEFVRPGWATLLVEDVVSGETVEGPAVATCPECQALEFRVIELGGPATEADDCEGACTL